MNIIGFLPYERRDMPIQHKLLTQEEKIDLFPQVNARAIGRKQAEALQAPTKEKEAPQRQKG